MYLSVILSEQRTTVNLKERLQFLCLPEFQSHHTLRLLLLRVNYI